MCVSLCKMVEGAPPADRVSWPKAAPKDSYGYGPLWLPMLESLIRVVRWKGPAQSPGPLGTMRSALDELAAHRVALLFGAQREAGALAGVQALAGVGAA